MINSLQIQYNKYNSLLRGPNPLTELAGRHYFEHTLLCVWSQWELLQKGKHCTVDASRPLNL